MHAHLGHLSAVATTHGRKLNMNFAAEFK